MKPCFGSLQRFPLCSAAAENLVKNASPSVRTIIPELYRAQRLNDAQAKHRIAQMLKTADIWDCEKVLAHPSQVFAAFLLQFEDTLLPLLFGIKMKSFAQDFGDLGAQAAEALSALAHMPHSLSHALPFALPAVSSPTLRPFQYLLVIMTI